MKLINPFPTPAFAFQQYNNRAELLAIITARATYEIVDGNLLRFMEEQPEIGYSDTFTGSEDTTAHLVHQADFVPYKPGTDVTVIGRSYAPSGKSDKSWLAGIKVGEKEKILRVFGPRYWEPVTGQDDWVMGEAEPASIVPLSYYQAFGGIIPRDDKHTEGKQDCHRFNPIGPGLISHEYSAKGERLPAPQIEATDDPITDCRKDYVPQGFAPIAPVWRFREQYTGTYDEQWLETKHPFLPPDFDYRFYNCAHPDLIFEPYLQGAEPIHLVNMDPVHRHIKLILPALKMEAKITYEDGASASNVLHMDGVHFDLLQEGPPRLRLTWRTAFAWQNGVKEIELKATRRIKAPNTKVLVSSPTNEELA